MMTNKNILISGASIAGPMLAYWLKRYGFHPTVVERAPKLREGGHAIDVRGRALDVAEQMGILARIQQASTNMREYSFVNKNNKADATMNAQALNQTLNGIEVMREDLSRFLYEKTKDDVEYRFGDSIQTLKEDAEGVEVTFERGDARRFDLIVGADGLHSVVRNLAFGDEAQFERFCGYYVSVFYVDNYLKMDHSVLLYNVPGKLASLYSAGDKKTGAFFAFKQPTKLFYDHNDAQQQKQLLRDAFAGEEWECSRLLERLETTPDFFFDAVSQIKMDRWSQGRTVLVGDASHCPSFLTGQGSTLAMIGAYMLAGELKAAAGDYQTAFKAYEQEFRPFVMKEQGKLGVGLNFLLPSTRFGILLRNQFSKLLSLNSFVSNLATKDLQSQSGSLKGY